MSNGNPMSEEDLANLSDDEIMGMAIPPSPVLDQSAVSETTKEPTDNGRADADDLDADAGGSVDQDDQDDDIEPNDSAGDDRDANAAARDEGAEDESSREKVQNNPLGADDESAFEEEDEKPGEGGQTGKRAENKSGTDADASATDDASDVAKKDDGKADKSADQSAETIDYKAGYEKIMAPFKAAGRTMQVKNPDEAIRLMQMGVDYGKKMSALQPSLKILRMLENHQLLDEKKLSFLIDLDKKDPAAVQKFIKESGVDPFDVDTEKEPDYKPGNYQVSDEEFRFSTTLEEVSAYPEGKSLIMSMNKTWDSQSKQALWQDPSIMKVLAEQKVNGIYDTISDEIDRRRTLGQLDASITFLGAYEQVGKELDAAGLLVPKSDATAVPGQNAQQGARPEQPATRQVVETRAHKPKPDASAARAKAASPSRGNAVKPAKPDFNPLSLSDEEFEKNTALIR